MRNLTSTELQHVYGGGKSDCHTKCHSKSKSKSRCKSKSKSKSKSRGCGSKSHNCGGLLGWLL
ncbi:hypothetical protein PO883_07130 [Massilia sp. DJPM01]|uniref:hypothetical protein n=1 Tax=Massilia sp. DJPM01 TaxID=3024404 RepID=UPI00259EE364|nr:hypothetical protein [Massilia sp. DJPM01]MDM5176970.1 hypothetical protein [Massilia sp. DJPM01]